MVYLDNAATTFPKPECVYETVDYVQRNMGVNVGRGSYSTALKAMKIVDETRYLMAKLLHIDDPDNVVFTPSATIAANEIIFGLNWDQYKTVYVSPFEHNAIARPLESVRQKYGIKVLQIPFEKETHAVCWDKLRTMFTRDKPDYVFVNQVSNVTGTIVPVEKIFAMSKEFGAVTIADGSQSVGLMDINMGTDNIDYLIFAGHKNLYSSLGVGGFIAERTPKISTILAGGTGTNSLDLSMGETSPVRFETASPNIIALSSLNSSIKWLLETGIDKIADRKKELTIALTDNLRNLGCSLYRPSGNLEHTSVVSFNVDGYTAAEVGSILDKDFDIAVRTGFHCAPYIHDLLDTRDCGGTIRASVGYFNTKEDVEALISAIKEL